jgi:uroporphyrinogen decarboxylase
MDALALDWRISMKQARAIVGPDRVLCGNVDPMVLYGTDEEIKRCVKQNIIDAGTTTYRLHLSSYSLCTIFL